MAERIGGKFNFRMGRKNAGATPPQWECDAACVDSSVADFVGWTRGKSAPCFSDFKPDSFWAYASYLRMDENPSLCNLKDDVPWRSIFPCLPDNSGSTFWLGNDQSHTGCHYDTYGINFVVQVFGLKRWILFPPSSTPFLYPTRLPLEESSVFSRINFQCADFVQYPLLLSAGNPYVITLEPGDILFVPRHWWHFVEAVEEPVSCAVNLWIDQPGLDDCVRFKEALTQLACFSMATCAPDDSVLKRFHENERIFVKSSDWFSQLAGFVSQAVNKLKSSLHTIDDVTESSLNWKSLELTDIVDILPDSKSLRLPLEPPKITTEKIVSAFLHPDVIDLVYSKLLE